VCDVSSQVLLKGCCSDKLEPTSGAPKLNDRHLVREGFDEATLREAIVDANVPTLLMVLAHLTQDDHWLDKRYAPKRPRGLADDNSGGLPAEVVQEICDAAVAALMQYKVEGTHEIPHLTSERFIELASFGVGEPLPEEYVEMLTEEAGFVNRQYGQEVARRSENQSTEVLIIGAGISGITAAISLKRLGVTCRIIEKREAVGGTWLGNTYPGVGVDTPSHIYDLSFALNPSWSAYYALGPEIREYVEGVAKHFNINNEISFNTTVDALDWDATNSLWRVTSHNDSGAVQYDQFKFVISSVGQLNRAKLPGIPGEESFDGESAHTSEWPANIDLAQKNVALIGSGASAMQVAPIIAQTVKKLYVFQRSPHWSAPSPSYRQEVSLGTRLLLERVPCYAAWYRARLLWLFNDRIHASLQIDPDWAQPQRSVNSLNDMHREYFESYIRDQLAGRPDLIELSIPNYPPFGKRMLIDNGWYTMLQRPNVQLVTTKIERIQPSGLLTDDGQEFDIDAIVYATGFEALNFLSHVAVTGVDGATLSATWGEDDSKAYLGIMVPGFPNFFMTYGPNTNLGHGGSIVFHTECQVRFISAVISQSISQGLRHIECSQAAFQTYNDAVDDAHSHMIWTHSGMDTWYRNSKGRVVTNSPWRLVDYWKMTRAPNVHDSVFVHD
jgi:4-hydroxyacetophenone monooxygenase